MAQEQIRKIYELKAVGGATVVEDVHAITRAFLECVEAKQLLTKMKGEIQDPKELASLTKQIDTLTKREKELTAQMREKQSILREQQISRQKEIADNEVLTGSYSQLSAKYKELLAIAKDSVNISNPAEVQAAANELANLKAQLDAFDNSLKKSTVSAKEQALALGTMAAAEGEVSAAMLAGREIEAARTEQEQARTSGVVVTEEETAALREQQLAMAELNVTANERSKILKERVIVEDVELTHVEQLAQTLLVAEQELIANTLAIKANNQALEAGAISKAEYIAAGTALTQQQTVLRANVASTRSELMAEVKSMLAVGTSMKELGLKVGILREEYRNLTIAQRESAEGKALLNTIQQMDGEIKRLDASIGNSQRNVGNYISAMVSLDNVGKKLITSFLRMGVHFLAFTVIMQAVSKIIEYFTEKIRESNEGVTEHSKALEHDAEVQDKWNARKQKAIDLLQKELDVQNKRPNVFGGQGTDSSREDERKLELLKAQQESGRNALKDKAANIKLDTEIFNLEQKITNEKISQVKNSLLTAQFEANQATGRGENARAQGIRELVNTLDEQRKDLENTLKVNELRFKTKQGDKYDPFKAPKAPKDEAKQEFQGRKELNDSLAELQKQRIDQDIEGNREVFQNEKETLADRLLAYENYTSDRKYQAEAERDREVANANAELVAVTKQLNDGKKKTQENINSLNSQHAAGLVKRQIAEEKYTATVAKIDADASKETANIVKSDIQTRLDGIEAIKEQAAAAANIELLALQDRFNKGNLSYKKYKEEEKKLADAAHIYELNLIKDYLAKQIAAFDAAGRDTGALENALSKVNQQLFDATNKQYDDLKKNQFDIQEFYKKLQAAALNASQTIAEGIIANQNRQIDKEKELARTQLDSQKQAALATATSAAEKAAIEKEYDQKAEQLERQAFERHKKQSEAELEIQFAVASIQAMSAGFKTGGIYGALAAEALVAIEFAAKLAVLKSQTYGAGGDLRKVLGNGGTFSGPSHATGGIKFAFDGLPREVEGKEGYVVAADSMQSSRITTVTGTPAQLASAANVMGGGINFAPGAAYGYGGSLGSGLTAPVFTPASGGSNDAMMVMFDTVRQLAVNQAATNGRIDRIQVSLNPNLVTQAQDKRSKLVKLTTL